MEKGRRRLSVNYLLLVVTMGALPGHSYAQEMDMGDALGKLPNILQALGPGACNSVDRLRERAQDLINWASDPASGIQNSTAAGTGVLWIAGRSDWNCKCMKYLVGQVGVDWRQFLDINGMSPTSSGGGPNWKYTCVAR